MKTIAIFALSSLAVASAFVPLTPSSSAVVGTNNKNNKVAVPPTALDLFGFGKKNAEAVEEETKAVVVEEPAAAAKPVVDKDIEKFMDEKEGDDKEQDNMMQQIKSAGTAGAMSLFLWELAFWAISIPVAIFTFVQLNGAWPDFGNQEDVGKVGAEAFAFANVARLALPVRIGLAVATIPWVEENIIQADWAPEFLKKEKSED